MLDEDEHLLHNRCASVATLRELFAFGQAIARLHQLSSAAVSTLGKVMLEGGTPPATRVRAADSILNHTIKAIENEDIETRVSALERAAEESGRRS